MFEPTTHTDFDRWLYSLHSAGGEQQQHTGSKPFLTNISNVSAEQRKKEVGAPAAAPPGGAQAAKGSGRRAGQQAAHRDTQR